MWQAKVRVRDASGKPRQVMRTSPPRNDSRGRPVPDRDGARARNAVLAAAAAISVSPLNAAITTRTTIAMLWTEHYRPYLVSQGRAENTLVAYDREASRFIQRLGGRRLTETPTTVIEAYLAELAKAHGPGSAKRCRSALSGMFRYAIRVSDGALTINPVREVELVRDAKPKGRTGGAEHIAVDHVRFILDAVRTSTAPCPRILSKAERERPSPLKRYEPPTVAEFCKDDMADYVDLLFGLNLRASQLRGAIWPDFDLKARVYVPSGKIIRVKGQGLVRVTRTDDPKNRIQPISIPHFAIKTLESRRKVLAARKLLHPDEIDDRYADLVFPSTNWTPRDPTNVDTDWRRIRLALGISDGITAHSFRKAGATAKDDAGLPLRVIADSLGQADINTTLRHSRARGKAHPEAADVLDRAMQPPAN
ncbi:integrase [Mycobacteroides sp. H001]|uniref:site-specific integrase n=1 Tax=Mycobacteroides TaxID=670516 RepID=UPI0007155174|nr:MULTISPECIES: tyrosine-type recombinase/integrase [Mycobacteroides]KRQ20791.1 integrase [Mycobacteroides sp. H072]KRQ38141.1 integrase [Mycobacteroides sp. H002]KRQ52947.1 integrase [Mycobacteroides sp. H054]KRQ66973.1 integrase [Mycobacteroides sp. H001]OHU36413.1 site-specific integrase [Mycobacteroides chelonae]